MAESRVAYVQFSQGTDRYNIFVPEGTTEPLAMKTDNLGVVTEVTLTAQEKSDLVDTWKQALDDVAVQAPFLYPTTIFGLESERPAAGQPGGKDRFFIATDTKRWFHDDGAKWQFMFGSPFPGGPNLLNAGDYRSTAVPVGQHQH